MIYLVMTPKSELMCWLISGNMSRRFRDSMRFVSTMRRDGSYSLPLQYTLQSVTQPVYTFPNLCIPTNHLTAIYFVLSAVTH